MSYHIIGSTVSNSFALLKNAELELRNIIAERLDTAVDDHDRDSVVRYVLYFYTKPLCHQGILTHDVLVCTAHSACC